MVIRTRHSRQGGQGALEYILIIVVGIVLVGGAAWMFREPLSRVLDRAQRVMSGEAAADQSADSSEDSQAEGGDESAPSETGGGSGAEGSAAPGEGENAASDTASSDQGGEAKGKRVTEEYSEGLPDEDVGTGWSGGVGIWVAVGAGLFIVLVVLYFLNASKR